MAFYDEIMAHGMVVGFTQCLCNQKKLNSFRSTIRR
jgi:hypothetical protein